MFSISAKSISRVSKQIAGYGVDDVLVIGIKFFWVSGILVAGQRVNILTGSGCFQMRSFREGTSILNRITGKSFILVMGVIFITGYILMNTLFPDYFMTQSNGNAYVETNIIYASELGDILQAYSETGRECYVRLSITYDYILPLQYSLFFASCLLFLLKKHVNIKWQKTVFIFGGILCLTDWLENTFIIIAIIRFPSIGVLPIMAQIMTLLKTALTVAFLLTIFIGIVILVASKIKNRN